MTPRIGISIMTLLSALFLVSTSQALDVVDASVLCDRFIGGSERNQCLSFVKKQKPDTYVSSVCHYLFDDKIFDSCLKLAARVSVNPKELVLCSDSELADEDRLNCIKKRSRAGREFQRMPASFSARKPASAKPKPAASSSGIKEYPESKAGL